MTRVNKGQLTETFLYATPGAEGLRQAVKLLNGEKIPPVITLRGRAGAPARPPRRRGGLASTEPLTR